MEEFIVQPQQERPSTLPTQVLLHLCTHFYTCTHMDTKYTNTQIYFKVQAQVKHKYNHKGNMLQVEHKSSAATTGAPPFNLNTSDEHQIDLHHC